MKKKLKNNYKDKRGRIVGIFINQPKDHCTLVTFNKRAVRGNHFHKRSTQYAFVISGKLKTVIANTSVGNISEPILLPNGILFFKVRDKKTIEKTVDMEKVKNQLVNSEKTKILNMHSTSHFNNLRASVTVKFFQLP